MISLRRSQGEMRREITSDEAKAKSAYAADGTATAIGAANRARSIEPERAVAVARTWTESIPKSLAKTPGALRLTVTVIVSLASLSLDHENSPAPPSFLPAHCAP